MSEDKNQTNTEAGSALLDRIRSGLPEGVAVIEYHEYLGDDTVVVEPVDILVLMNYLKNDPDLDFDLMLDVTAVDYLGKEDVVPYIKERGERFEIVYHLTSVSKNHRLRVKAPLNGENPEINSITPLWIGSDWLEREVYDLYGVKFPGHHDLRRILLYDGFEGHPLRKDFPKTGRQPMIGPRN